MRVGKEWKYLYRAVDSAGDTTEVMLSARRDVSSAKRFFKNLMSARLPFTVCTDRYASYPEVFATSAKEKALPTDCKLRRVKYLNDVGVAEGTPALNKFPIDILYERVYLSPTDSL